MASGKVLTGVALVAVASAGYAALFAAGRISGSTRAERSRRLPGDGLVPDAGFVTNHAATLGAPPERVWPWLTQVGWHRGGWYTPRWVDRLLFPGNWPSAARLDPALVRSLVPGDVVPDGPPGTAQFVVEVADAPRVLVLHSTTHLPPGWAERFGARLDWVWIFALDPVGIGRTRMLIRNRGSLSPGWLHVAYQAIVVPADHIMARGMLEGLQQRVVRSPIPGERDRSPGVGNGAPRVQLLPLEALVMTWRDPVGGRTEAPREHKASTWPALGGGASSETFEGGDGSERGRS